MPAPPADAEAGPGAGDGAGAGEGAGEGAGDGAGAAEEAGAGAGEGAGAGVGADAGAGAGAGAEAGVAEKNPAEEAWVQEERPACQTSVLGRMVRLATSACIWASVKGPIRRPFCV